MKYGKQSKKTSDKVLKSKQQGLFVYNFHDLPSPLGEEKNINAVFIDPGTKNCGFRAVNMNNGSISTYFHDLIHFAKKGESFSESMKGAVNFVNDMKLIFTDAHYIVIERQMSFNYDLTRMSQHLISCIAMITKDTGNRPLIVEIDSRLKSASFDRDRVGTTTKKLGIDAARRICEEREDFETLQLINSHKKKDDICDVLCYEYIWWSLLNDSVIEIPKPTKDCNVKILTCCKVT